MNDWTSALSEDTQIRTGADTRRAAKLAAQERRENLNQRGEALLARMRANEPESLPAPPRLVQVGVTPEGQKLYAESRGTIVPVSSGTTNTMAVLALVFGVLGGLIAIIFGHLALNQIKKNGDSGYGMAMTGLVLGYAWLVGWVILYFWVGTLYVSLG